MARRVKVSFRAKGRRVTFYARPNIIRRKKRRRQKSWWSF